MQCGGARDEGVRLPRGATLGGCSHGARFGLLEIDPLLPTGAEDEDATPVGVLVARRLVVEGRHRGLRGVLAHRARHQGRRGE